LATGIKAWKNRVGDEEYAWGAVIDCWEGRERGRIGRQLRENCVGVCSDIDDGLGAIMTFGDRDLCGESWLGQNKDGNRLSHYIKELEKN
jgi:hypothetical protein